MKPPAKSKAKETSPEIVKTTLRLPKDLWIELQHRAIDDGLSLQEIAERAFQMYLKGGR